MDKVVLVAFNGEMMCFVHVLLNALDMDAKGMEARIVFEGTATKLVAELAKEGNAFRKLYLECRDKGLLAGACRACSAKTGSLESVQAEGLPLLDDMNGHPSLAAYMRSGFTVLTF